MATEEIRESFAVDPRELKLVTKLDVGVATSDNGVKALSLVAQIHNEKNLNLVMVDPNELFVAWQTMIELLFEEDTAERIHEMLDKVLEE